MADRTDSLIGKVLGGKYKLVERIGEGSYAVVFRAWQGSLQRHVAVKVLFPRIVMDDNTYHEFLTRFKREAAIIAQFQHDHIVPIFDYGEHDGRAYLVMPHLPGGNLQDMLTRRGKLSLQETLPYIEQAASALDYAHARHVIHRDLKPSNFLLGEAGQLVLADFGIARILQHNHALNPITLTKTDVFLGTPAYMAPEMVQSHSTQPIDHRVDIYELGIVLFQMLSGDVPFKGSDVWSVLLKHMGAPLPLLSQVNPTIPPTVDAVLQQATAKKPGDRYASAGELSQALHTVVSLTDPVSVDPRYAQTVLSPGIPVHRSSHLPSQPPYSATLAATQTMPNTVPSSFAHAANYPVKRPAIALHKLILSLAFIIAFIIVLTLSIVTRYPLSATPSSPTPISTTIFTPTPTPTLTPQQVKAEEIVQQYHADINNRNYFGAYTISHTDGDLTTPSPGPNDCSSAYGQFVDGYSSTEHDDIAFQEVQQVDSTTFKVWYTITSTEILPSGTRTSIYHQYHFVSNKDGTWKLLQGENTAPPQIDSSTPPTDSGSTPSEQAQATVQQYLDAINQHDYPTAYNLQWHDLRASETYCNFINSYTNTQYSNVTFQNITPQPDGTVTVVITVSITKATASGTTTSSDQQEYSVGQDNGSWKILAMTTPTKNVR
jgi:serine/threonine protein kinase